MNKRLICLILTLIFALPIAGCGDSKSVSKQVVAMDTIMTLTAYGSKAEKGIKAAESVIISLDSACNPNSQTSSVYQINHANGDTVSVSGQVADMLTTALDIYKRTDGSYDLTIYPLVERWGFTNGQYYVPSANEISNDLSKLCMDKLTLEKYPTSGTYAVSIPYYGQLSFASIAKGCASKYAIDAMRNVGVKSAVISLGGNVQTLGNKPDGSEWKIAIQDPYRDDSYIATITIGEAAVVTSGTYQRYFISSDGTTYHHIINPKSGYPTTNGLVSVTIICDDGVKADALSTAMFVLGKSAALSYWRSNGGFDMIIINENNEITATAGLIEKVDVKNTNYTLTYVE